MFFCMIYDCVTMTVTYDIILASNPKSKIRKINRNQNKNEERNENK